MTARPLEVRRTMPTRRRPARDDATAEDASRPRAYDIRPATHTRFSDVALILGPKNPDANVCWCLSHRIPAAENRSLAGPARRDYVEQLTRKRLAPGVLAYDGDDVVGWAAVAPRSAVAPLTRSTKIPNVDNLPVWSVWCFRVRAGHRGRGVAQALLGGAVDFARDHGAPAIEGYPVDNHGGRVDLTMAFVGMRSMFEHAGFEKVAMTESVSGGIPRVVMRKSLS